MCKEFANLLDLRYIMHGTVTWAELLYTQVLSSKKGVVVDRWANASVSDALGWKVALEICPDKTNEDQTIGNCGPIKSWLRGFSCFAFPKVLRYIVRSGCKLVQADCVNSHLTHILRNLPPDLISQLEIVPHIVSDRPKFFEDMQSTLKHPVGIDIFKKVTLATVYGGGPAKHCAAAGFSVVPTGLYKLRRDIEKIADWVAVQFPDKLQLMVDLKKKMPKISLLSYWAAMHQRVTIDKMMPLGGGPENVASYERDCLVFVKSFDVSEMRAGVDLPITVEVYPNKDKIMQMLKKKFPYKAFDQESKLDMGVVLKAFDCCKSALRPFTDAKGNLKIPKKCDNTTDFGTYVAYLLEPVVIGAEKNAIEVYDTSGRFGMWTESLDGTKRLQQLTRNIMLKIFLPSNLKMQDGKVVSEYWGDAPLACKNAVFYNQVAEDVRKCLYTLAPSIRVDSTPTWRFLQDASGVIFDSLTGNFIVNEPSIRIRRHLPWTFSKKEVPKTIDDVWDAPQDVKDMLDSRLQRIFDYWLVGGDPKDRALGKDPIFGVPLQTALWDFVSNCEHCKLWHLIAPIFAKSAEDDAPDIDMVLWKFCHYAADFLIWVKRTETNYFKGPGACGKDVLIMLATYFLGDKAEDGFMTLFPSDHFTRKHKPSAGLDPVLDSAKAARLVIINEIPEHTWYNHDGLKPLCESRGSGLVSRDLYKSPARWIPCCGIDQFSNHKQAMSVAQSKDTGVRRRTNYKELYHTFPDDVEKDVKALVETGCFNGELMWISFKFHQYLQQCPAGSKRIHPRPQSLEDDTNALLESATDLNEVKDWIEDNCHAVRVYKDATVASTLKQIIANHLGISYVKQAKNEELELKLANAKVGETRFGSGRVLLYHFPDMPRTQAVALNDDYVLPTDDAGKSDAQE